MRILVTGGAGFIGSALVRQLIAETSHEVLNVDRLSYAANLDAVAAVSHSPRYRFAQTDICDRVAIQALYDEFQPDAVMHLAGESHVDSSLKHPELFVDANIVGTEVMLECARRYWSQLTDQGRQSFRFLFVSTEEVYGSRNRHDTVDESAPFLPNSPYAGSKAAATHLVRSYRASYGLPVLITYSSNNYGPWQHPEKMIAKTITRALQGEAIPVYGAGLQQRSWLYVDDHVSALLTVLNRGVPGEGYNIGGAHEVSNRQLVQQICARLDHLRPREDGSTHADLISYVADRPGHDWRYGIDDGQIRGLLGWQPELDFKQGLDLTIRWHLDRLAVMDSRADVTGI